MPSIYGNLFGIVNLFKATGMTIMPNIRMIRRNLFSFINTGPFLRSYNMNNLNADVE